MARQFFDTSFLFQTTNDFIKKYMIFVITRTLLNEETSSKFMLKQNI